MNFAETRLPRSLEHPFGTDRRARHVCAVWIGGGPVSLAIAFAVSIVILAIGVAYGSISGYPAGAVDNGMMRLLDALYGLPYLPFAIMIIAIMLRTVERHPLATWCRRSRITTWFTAARIMRGQMLSLKQNEYVGAARANGARWSGSSASTSCRTRSASWSSSIFLEIPNGDPRRGVPVVPRPRRAAARTSWGSSPSEGYEAYRHATRPDLGAGLADRDDVLCANVVADGLRDALDPRDAGELRRCHGTAGGHGTSKIQFHTRDRRGEGGRRRLVLGRRGRDARHRRRVRLRQERDLALDHAPDPQAAGERSSAARCSSTAATSSKLTEDEMRKVRGNEIAMIFQDPMTSLNPVLKIGDADHRGARSATKSMTKGQAATRALELHGRGRDPAPRERLDDYPHQFSGGMRQRVMIAMALACNPSC